MTYIDPSVKKLLLNKDAVKFANEYLDAYDNHTENRHDTDRTAVETRRHAMMKLWQGGKQLYGYAEFGGLVNHLSELRDKA